MDQAIEAKIWNFNISGLIARGSKVGMLKKLSITRRRKLPTKSMKNGMTLSSVVRGGFHMVAQARSSLQLQAKQVAGGGGAH